MKIKSLVFALASAFCTYLLTSPVVNAEPSDAYKCVQHFARLGDTLGERNICEQKIWLRACVDNARSSQACGTSLENNLVEIQPGGTSFISFYKSTGGGRIYWVACFDPYVPTLWNGPKASYSCQNSNPNILDAKSEDIAKRVSNVECTGNDHDCARNACNREVVYIYGADADGEARARLVRECAKIFSSRENQQAEESVHPDRVENERREAADQTRSAPPPKHVCTFPDEFIEGHGCRVCLGARPGDGIPSDPNNILAGRCDAFGSSRCEDAAKAVDEYKNHPESMRPGFHYVGNTCGL